MNWPKIDVPPPSADIVRVTDRVPELRPLAANITNVCHDCSPVGFDLAPILADLGHLRQHRVGTARPRLSGGTQLRIRGICFEAGAA